MALTVVLDVKDIVKMPAPNKLVGYTAYKDFKIIRFQLGLIEDDNDPVDYHSPILRHTFDHDSIILWVMGRNAIETSAPGAATGGMAIESQLYINEEISICNIMLAAKSMLATDSGYRDRYAAEWNQHWPGLWIPMMEMDKIRVGYTGAFYSASGGVTGIDCRYAIGFIEK